MQTTNPTITEAPGSYTYWDTLNYAASATYSGLGTAASYIPGVSYMWSTPSASKEAVLDDSTIDRMFLEDSELVKDAVKNIFLTAMVAEEIDAPTPQWVAEQMGIDVGTVQKIYDESVQPQLEAMKKMSEEKALVVSYYHQYVAGDISARNIAISTGLTSERVIEIFNSL